MPPSIIHLAFMKSSSNRRSISLGSANIPSLTRPKSSQLARKNGSSKKRARFEIGMRSILLISGWTNVDNWNVVKQLMIINDYLVFI